MAILPWLWVSAYAVLVALITAVGRLHYGITAATTDRYMTGALFFWIGFAVVAAVAVQDLMLGSPRWVRATLKMATLVVGMTFAVDYAVLYRHGYRGFVETYEDRRLELAELYRHETGRDEALSSLYPPSVDHVRQYAQVLEQRRLGPFSRMSEEERRRLGDPTSLAERVVAGEGVLTVAKCTIIGGWAWDREQPSVPVEVEIYDGNRRLATVPAYWFRWDLRDMGIGNGRHGYIYNPAPTLKDGREHLIRAKISGAGQELTGTPKRFVCNDKQSVRWGNR
jgi:hypothetical protein